MSYRLDNLDGEGPFTIDDLRQKVVKGELAPDQTIVDDLGNPARLGDVLGQTAMAVPVPGPAPAKSKNSKLIIALVAAVLVLCLCVPVGAAIVFPLFATARQSAVQTSVMSEMKDLGSSLALYSAEHGGNLPPDMSTGEGILASVAEVSPEKDFTQLQSGTLEGNHELSGKAASSVERPELTILVYYSDKKIGESMIVLFADYHAAKVPMMEFLETRNNNTYEMRR